MIRRALAPAFAALLACAAAPELPLAERLQQEALAFAEAQGAGQAGHLALKVLRPPALPPVKAGKVRLEPSHLSKREPMGVFFVAFRVYVDGHLAGTARVDLEGRWTGTLLRTRTALPRKAVPQASDVEEVPFEGTPLPGALGSLPEGQRLRQHVPAGKLLTRADLEPIPLVSTGDRVSLTLRSGALSVRTEATARSQGALGERVRVELSSRRQLTGKVVGPGAVDTAWGA